MALTRFASNKLSASRPTLTSRANNAKRFTNIRANSLNLTNPTIPTTYFVFSTSTPTFPEGANTTVTVQGYGLATAAQNGTYYWTIESNAGDFGTISGNFTLTWRGDAYGYSIGSFALNPTLDGVTEGNETFTIAIRTGSTSGTIISTSLPLTINDTVYSDNYFNYVTLLLLGNGTNNANNNVFVDGSNSIFTVTRNGTPTQGTFSPYGNNWSNYFSGSGDTYIHAENASNFYDNNPLTAEGWFYADPSSLSNSSTMITNYQNSSNGWTIQFDAGSGNKLVVCLSGDVLDISSTTTILSNTWYHFAVSGAAGSFKLFLNGVQEGSTYTGAVALNSNQGLTIGAFRWPGFGTYNRFAGYLSSIRITQATLYTSNFTPSTTPLTSVTNTYLLTCNSNCIADTGPNKFSGLSTFYSYPGQGTGVSVQRFSPFFNTAAYSTSTIGGSISLNGSSDWLSIPNNAAFDIGSNDFTIEGWVHPTSSVVSGAIVLKYGQTSPWPSWYIGIDSGNWDIVVYYGSSSGVTITASTIPIQYNSWYHFALVRNGANYKFYVNGLQVATGVAQTMATNTHAVTIGNGDGRNFYLPGYISDVRIINGTAVYTGNFTPPSAPLLSSGTSTIYPNTANVNTSFTATNTSLLCNFTNAGIIDNSMQVNLETVGDAKISTIQSKYGGSSMSFDGSGDYLFIPTADAKPLSKFLTGNFTVECWAYLTTTGTSQTIICAVNNWAAGANYNIRVVTGNFLSVQIGNSITLINGTVAFPLNQWNHIALVRDSATSTKFYLNGSNVASTATNWTADEDCPVTIGAFNTNGSSIGEYWTGYIDDLRITNGIARYTTTFTPPALSFPTQ